MFEARRIKNWQIVAFVVLVFLFSWACWLLAHSLAKQGFYVRIGGSWYGVEFRTLLGLAGNLAPGIVALVLSVVCGGRAELQVIWKRSSQWRIGAVWYLFALAFPWVIFFAAVLLTIKPGGGTLKLESPLTWCSLFLVNLPFAPLWEELGWRGYLLPALQATRSGLKSSMIVGVIWGLWHIPLYWNAPPDGINPIDFLLEFCLYTVGLSVIFTWLYNRTSGSIIPVALLHACLNATSLYLLDPSIATSGSRPILFATGFAWLTALVIVASGKDLDHNPDSTHPAETIAQNESTG
jgi:membrane protease YdiL (CAAX protease family)